MDNTNAYHRFQEGNDDILREDTIFGLVINPKPDGGTEVSYGTAIEGDHSQLILDTLFTYFCNAVESKWERGIDLLQKFMSVTESVKATYPNIAASVRKQNIEYIKKQTPPNEPNNR